MSDAYQIMSARADVRLGKSDLSMIQAQKQQRLKINRVAIIQALRVEHVLPYLSKNQIVTPDDKQAIMTPRSTQDRVRRLLDLLPAKGKDIDWYGHFREALKNPDARSGDVRKKYQILVDFLDNTIIPSPVSPRGEMRLPKYEPLPGIDSRSTHSPLDNRELEEKSDRSLDEKGILSDGPEYIDKEMSLEQKPVGTLVKGKFHRWVQIPPNFMSLVKEPAEHFRSLQESEKDEDISQLKTEKDILGKIRNLEVVAAMDKQGLLPEGFEICMCSAAEDLLSDPNIFHIYYKYFHQLSAECDIHVSAGLASSFCRVIEDLGEAVDSEIQRHVTKIGFRLFELIHGYGLYSHAEQVLHCLINYLSLNPGLETWMSTWEAFVQLLAIRNTNVDFREADQVYNGAVSLGEKIKLMSFGNDLLCEAKLFMELSTVMKEQGSVGPAYAWAKKALKEAISSNEIDVADVLCGASMAYSLHFRVTKADALAVEAIRYAMKVYGPNHPKYLKALINYCNFSNEYRQDDMAVEVARRAVDKARVTYGGLGCATRAEAHQALARALMVSRQCTGDEYHSQATAAWRMAVDALPEGHPRLAPFRYTLAQSLLQRAVNGPEDQKNGTLVWAETEAKGALQVFKARWGHYSLKTAQALVLLGHIYSHMNRMEEAEAALQEGLDLLRVAMTPSSYHVFVAQASMGTFYKLVNRPLDAIALLTDVVSLDCGGAYVTWVHDAFEALVDLFRAVGRDGDADFYQEALADWIKSNPKPSQPITWDRLHAQPATYQQFLADFDAASVKLRAVVKEGHCGIEENVQEVQRETKQ